MRKSIVSDVKPAFSLTERIIHRVFIIIIIIIIRYLSPIFSLWVLYITLIEFIYIIIFFKSEIFKSECVQWRSHLCSCAPPTTQVDGDMEILTKKNKIKTGYLFLLSEKCVSHKRSGGVISRTAAVCVWKTPESVQM